MAIGSVDNRRWPSVERRLLYLVVLAAGAMHWLTPRRPPVDWPRHVAQVAATRDLLTGASAGAGGLRINLLTPALATLVLIAGCVACRFWVPATCGRWRRSRPGPCMPSHVRNSQFSS